MGPATSIAPPDPETVETAVATIVARDPAFNLDALLAEAQQAFWLVGEAYAKCQPELCEGVLSPSLTARERGAIQDACQKRKVLAPHDGDAKTGQLLSISADAATDTVTVHFASTWSATGGGGREERRIQNWCFQRPAGSTTLVGSAGARCANCGAALESSTGTCRYCGALIGSGSGWRVIRIDDVSAQSAAEAAAVMRSIMSEVIAQGRLAQLPERPAPQPAPTRRRHRVLRLIRLVFFLAAALTVVVLAAAATTGRFHHDAAKVLPFIRHPELTGTMDLNGQISATNLATVQKPPAIQLGGTCRAYGDRTSWDFTSKLPDGSSFSLEFSLPPGQGGPGIYGASQLTFAATADNAQQTSTWEGSSNTKAALSLDHHGGGLMTFTGLAPSDTGGRPLAGQVSWNCSVS